MKKKLATAGLVLLAVSGCTTSRTTYGPDGREAFSLNCSGIALTWGSCYEKAGSICGSNGYTVVSANGETGAVLTANPQSVFGSSVITRSLVVSCNAAPKASEATSEVKKNLEPRPSSCAVAVVSAGGKAIPKDEQCPRPAD